MTAAKLAFFLFRYRHLIREFLPIVHEVLRLLKESAPEARSLQARRDTSPLQDLTELAVKREPNLTERVFKRDER